MSAHITSEMIAEHLHGGEMRIGRTFAGYLDVSAEGAVVRIKFVPVKGWPELGGARDYRAVVVEGETAPIVLPRLDTSFLGLDFEGEAIDDPEGTGWQVVPYSTVRKWVCEVAKADSVVFRGAPGVVSTAEARRFAAALVAVAAAVDAAQAERDGAS